MPDDEEIDLAALSDDDLVRQMHDDLYDGLAEEIAEGTQILLDRGWPPEKVLNDALVEGMRIVGIDFRDGILFVPEVLLAANAMKAGMALLRPLLAETGAERVGKVVIGTVKGDIHDIGKNLVAMMLEGAGFDVVDLGVNNPVEKYLAALEEHKPDILGMSALLTTTMPYMKVVIDDLIERGIRDDYIVLVGGAPLNEEFGKAVGADAYCRDAAVAAETAQALVLARRAAARAVMTVALLDEDVAFDAPARPRVLVIACGAIAREVLAVVRANGWTHITLRCLPGKLHNTPQLIADRVEAKLREAEAEPGWDGIFVAYGDCGTGGALDRVLARHPGVERLPGDHCYAFFAGVEAWLAMHEAEPRTFYLTDFLCRHFDRFVVQGLRLDTHPELKPLYFGNYVRVVYLSQIDDPELIERARAAADYLGLGFEHIRSGYGDLAPSLAAAVGGSRP